MNKIKELLERRVDKIYPSKKALEKVLRSGKKLRLYQGFDPSRPNLHLGHLAGLLTLKQFQQLGHEVIFLIGDFTGTIGDPTGKSETRRALTQKQVKENAQTYQEQAGMVLDFTGKNPVKMKFNSAWLSKLKFADVLKIAHHFTVPQLLERDMFQQRLKENKEIYLSEFMYPVMQGYDSVAMEVDLEVGGSDQLFNMMAGRKLIKGILNKEKFVLTTKILADAEGRKIGKTEGNAINIINPPETLFGQIMNLSDDCIVPCFELATEVPLARIGEIKKSLKAGANPMKFKKELAGEIVAMLYNSQARTLALSHFEKVFQGRGVPEKVKSVKLKVKSWNLIDLLVKLKLASSKSEAKRLINQGAVKINNETIRQLADQSLTINSGDIIQVGKKKWVKIK